MLKLTKRNGFTLIELLVVISIIVILAGLVLVGLMTASRKAKEGVARTEISLLKTALDQYYSDYGAYPEDAGGSFSSDVLVNALKGGPNKKRYFQFKKRRTKNGEYYSPLNEPFFYRENRSKSTKTPEMHNWDSYDIWTKDRKDKEKGINNWD